MGGESPKLNRDIRSSRVRVVLPDKTTLGVVSLSEALDKAQELDLDLVEVAPNADPPVCKIMDYGKHRYETTKREREQRKNQSKVVVKEIKLRPKTEEHDIAHKSKQIIGFLKDKCKVKIIVMFKGRELSHPEQATILLDKVMNIVGDNAVVESSSREGRNFTVWLSPSNHGDLS